MSNKVQYNKLSELFYNPKTGFVSPIKLIQKARANNINLTNEEISNWYNEQDVNQVYHEKPIKKEVGSYFEVVAPHIGYLEADLIDISNLEQSLNTSWVLVQRIQLSAFPLLRL